MATGERGGPNLLTNRDRPVRAVLDRLRKESKKK